MKIFKVVLSVLEIMFGLAFLVFQASDIQLGFGLILLFMGLNSISNLFPVQVR